ncbi:MAG: CarD family transcriptional regulator [Clostridiales bacterium]|nr:CarD family transcriptional regulator [Clostridiales bacterium]
MFNIGDIFVYGSNGVCSITDIKTEKFGSEVKTYYILSPYFDSRETIYVPVDNEKLVSKMKELLTEEQIIEMIKSIPNRDNIWIENINMRKEEFKKIIKNSKRNELLALMKTLHARREELSKAGKNLSVFDERFLKQAQNIIHSEIALVLHIKPEEVEPFIEKTISAA